MKKRFGFIKVTRIYRSILLYSLHIDCTDGEFEKQAFFPNCDCSKIGKLAPSTAKVGEKRHFARKFFSNPFSAARKSGSSGRKSQKIYTTAPRFSGGAAGGVRGDI
jgi:hypothetical protein